METIVSIEERILVLTDAIQEWGEIWSAVWRGNMLPPPGMSQYDVSVQLCLLINNLRKWQFELKKLQVKLSV